MKLVRLNDDLIVAVEEIEAIIATGTRTTKVYMRSGQSYTLSDMSVSDIQDRLVAVVRALS